MQSQRPQSSIVCAHISLNKRRQQMILQELQVIHSNMFWSAGLLSIILPNYFPWFITFTRSNFWPNYSKWGYISTDAGQLLTCHKHLLVLEWIMLAFLVISSELLNFRFREIYFRWRDIPLPLCLLCLSPYLACVNLMLLFASSWCLGLSNNQRMT